MCSLRLENCVALTGLAARSLTFDVGEFRGYFPVTHSEDINPANVPGPIVAQLTINPQNHGAIAAHNHILGVELCV